MALSSIIGRASSPVLPLAIRTVGSLRSFHGDIATAINVHERTILSPKNSFQSHSYSSAASPSAVRKLVDENLIRIITSEIKITRNRVQELPKRFPFRVEINPKGRIVLKREHADEKIQVHVTPEDDSDSDSDSSQSESDDTTDDSEDDSCGETNADKNKDKNNDSKKNSNYTDDSHDDSDDSGDGRNKESSGSSFHMIVAVIKGNSVLLFEAVASADNIAIKGMGIDDGCLEERPDISALNVEVKHAWQRYLEIRGIKPSMTEYLQKYMINKNSKEELQWLKKLRRIIKNKLLQ